MLSETQARRLRNGLSVTDQKCELSSLELGWETGIESHPKRYLNDLLRGRWHSSAAKSVVGTKMAGEGNGSKNRVSGLGDAFVFLPEIQPHCSIGHPFRCSKGSRHLQGQNRSSSQPLDCLLGTSAMRCCAGFFMGNTLSDPKHLLILFPGTNPANFLEARLNEAASRQTHSRARCQRCL
jgi:hypothetical protein